SMNGQNTKRIIWIFLWWISLIPVHTSAQNTLYAGAAEVNITPPEGFPHYRGYSTGVHDSLYAKTQYFRQGDVEIALVECDLLWISREVSKNTRLLIQKKLGIPFSHIIIAGTHSHTSPAYDSDILELNEHLRHDPVRTHLEDGREYSHWLGEQILASVRQARSKAVSSRLSMAKVDVDHLSFNRRYVMADGRVRTNPGILNPEALYPEGPIDPELGILLISNADGETTSGL